MISLLLFSILFFACDNKEAPENNPNKEDISLHDKHFDLWIPLESTSGMGFSGHVVKRMESLDKGVINIDNSGVDVSEKLYSSFMTKNGYYYQISKDRRFGKYKITNTGIEVVKEISYTTFEGRKHAFAWMSDKVLLLIGAADNSQKIIWSKFDTDQMKEIAKGDLDLEAPLAHERFNTSGFITYRKKDDKIFYMYEYKPLNSKKDKPRGKFYLAVINGKTMEVESVDEETRAQFPASTAYGELRQIKSFYDEKGDYYVACNSTYEGAKSYTQQHGSILRIKHNELGFDKSYNGYTEERGKIITMNYAGNRKAILYMQDPIITTNKNDWSSKTNPYIFYYLSLDLDTKEVKKLPIPHATGNFSQYVCPAGDKTYIGNNPAPSDGGSKIYIYDSKTEKLTEGASFKDGLQIDRIQLIKN